MDQSMISRAARQRSVRPKRPTVASREWVASGQRSPAPSFRARRKNRERVPAAPAARPAGTAACVAPFGKRAGLAVDGPPVDELGDVLDE